jgi:hypothetical protein
MTPTPGCRVPARTMAVPHLHGSGRRARLDGSRFRSLWGGVCRHRRRQNKQSCQRHSQNAHVYASPRASFAAGRKRFSPDLLSGPPSVYRRSARNGPGRRRRMNAIRRRAAHETSYPTKSEPWSRRSPFAAQEPLVIFSFMGWGGDDAKFPPDNRFVGGGNRTRTLGPSRTDLPRNPAISPADGFR